MRTTLLIALLALLGTGRAHAEDRTMMVDVGVGFGGPSESSTYPDFATGRITLGWENAPPPLPETKGYRLAGSLVPEIIAGAVVNSDRAKGFVGAGLRAELLIGQRDMGLLEITAHGAVYVAMRGLVIGDQHEAMLELGVGEYFTRFRTRTRFGYELDFVTPTQTTTFDADPNAGIFFRFYVGFAP